MKENVKFYLSQIKSKEDLKELFIEKWNWDNPCLNSFIFEKDEESKNKIEECLVLAEKVDHKAVLFVLKNINLPERELKRWERKIITLSDIKQIIDHSVFIFSTSDFEYLDFVKAEKLGSSIKINRFSISPENRDKLRTPCEQLENLKINQKDTTFSSVRNCIEDAFSVDLVTEKFYDEYEEIFGKIKRTLIRQKTNFLENKEKKLNDYTHQILNRIMFLYFVQKRGCFSNDKNFLVNFWYTYKNQFKDENKFHQDWLNTLFFESLCQSSRHYKEKPYLGNFNEILKNAPYLNGGLFEKTELDEVGWQIPDELFDDIFEFFESYNFTVEESTPFDIDIAINPEMLGNIYEHLVNIEEKEEQEKAGIFYTPKVEIELMIRRSLVEFLFNKTKIEKEKLYRYIFTEIGEQIDYPFNDEEARKVLKELDEVAILDPACGSGHYLVVAQQILYQLKEILWEKLNYPHLSKYEEKKRIIERNIYGNDIKEWAVNIAKLRLWLDLFVDADNELLMDQREPLLPNLSFKIRWGDSLVQRIGRNIIPLGKIMNFVENRKSDLKNLIQRKEYVYKVSNQQEYKQTLYLEKKLLQNALSESKIKIKQEIQNISFQLRGSQHTFEFGEPVKEKQKMLFEERLEQLEKTLEYIIRIEEELRKQKEPPLIWDLAFAEIKGFDIVIANPPYVRQERIEDLNKFYSKNQYKEKLIEQTELDYIYDYEGRIKSKSPIPKKFDKNCNLYVYFYLKGLKLLNPDGVLCYISSNSWLDVGFGRILQEVLIKRCPIVAIYDNQVKRSFKHADVNTIIALIKAPKEKDFDEEVKNNEVRFVMFKKPFEEIIYSEIFIDLEKDYNLKEFQEGKRRENEIYRLYIVNQKDLWEFGKDEKTGQYIGNKWGGKYLRAPEIYWKILEKGKGKLVRLGDIAEVKRGFTTGANEFFYVEDVTDKIEFSEIKSRIKNLVDFKSLEEIKKAGLRIVKNTKTGDYWLIEEEFLKPVIKSPRECKTILIKPKDLKYKVLMVQKAKEELKGKKVLDYIEWGEKQGFHRLETVKNRKYWYSLNDIKTRILSLRATADRPAFYISNTDLNHDQTFYSLSIKDNFIKKYEFEFGVLLNNSVTNFFFREFTGGASAGLALGVKWLAVYEMEQLYVILDNNIFKFLKKLEIIKRKPKSIFVELGFDPNKPIREQELRPLPDRKALDDIVFDALDLTEEERKEVYWAVAELVQNRLKKAKSV